MPHQGIVALTISLLSIAITLSVLAYNLRSEKQFQAQNKNDKH